MGCRQRASRRVQARLPRGSPRNVDLRSCRESRLRRSRRERTTRRDPGRSACVRLPGSRRGPDVGVVTGGGRLPRQRGTTRPNADFQDPGLLTRRAMFRAETRPFRGLRSGRVLRDAARVTARSLCRRIFGTWLVNGASHVPRPAPEDDRLERARPPRPTAR